MSAFRVGVVGVGHLGSHHARAWSKIEGASLVGAYDPDPVARERAASELGLRIFDSLDSLADSVDLVSIAAPTPRHADLTLTCLSRGLHVLVEKPMARTPEEGEAMLLAARSKQLALFVGQVERFNPAVQAARPYLKSPRFIEAHRLAPIVPRGIDVDVVLDLMIHDLDLALWLTRSRVTQVHAVGVPVLTPRIDIANARLTFASGCVANVTASRVSREKVRKIRFFEANEYLSIDCLKRSVEAYTLRPSESDAPEDLLRRIRPLEIHVEARDPLESELTHFLALAREPEGSWEETEIALDALRVADEVRTQAVRNLALDLPV
ncbi:MAG TPA: Gfo/Idh/MocA family oxidoreductase [Candidatus Limnocylindrales bacterium]|nr:Gfo/Idh/MocA family oxidoreductase [Candidatus Limnocylindrales bacterium]